MSHLVLQETIVRAEIVSWVMDALGPENERVGEQLADSIVGILVKHAAPVDELELDRAKLRAAIAQACAESVAMTLSLLAAAARQGKR